MAMTIERARRLRAKMEQIAANLDDKTASGVVEFASRLKNNGELVNAGTRINWNGTLKRAAVALWDNEQNNPDNAPDLWEDVLYRDGERIIPAVITAGLAFAQNELGWWGDVLYRSILPTPNTWTPEQYPAGWEIAE